MDITHYELLKECSDKKDITKWNLYRLNNPDKDINLKFMSLRNFYLLEADMRNINLQFTSLKDTKMNGSDVDNSRVISKFTLIFMSIFFMLCLSLVFYFFDYFISDIQIFKKFHREINSFASAILIQTSLVIGLSSSKTISKEKLLTSLLEILLVGIVVMIIIGLPSYYLLTWIFNDNVAWVTLFVFFSVVMFGMIYEYYRGQQDCIKYTKNPSRVINFNHSYLLDESEVTLLKEELARIDVQDNIQEEIEKELNESKTLSDEDKIRFQDKLDEFEKKELFRKEESEFLKSRIAILEKEEAEEKLIKLSMDTIKKAFSHIEQTERSLYLMNIIYGVLLLGGLVMLGYFGYLSYEHREEYFSKLKDISISASLGIIIFYATPILFAFSIIIFGITNLNKNIEAKEKLLEKRYLIDLLEATFYAQIKIGGNAKEALHKLINKLSESAYNQLLQVEKKDTNIKIKKRYHEKVTDKRVHDLLQVLIKKI